MGLKSAYTAGPSAELVRVVPGKGERCQAGMRASSNLLGCLRTCWLLEMLAIPFLGFTDPLRLMSTRCKVKLQTLSGTG